MAQIELPAPPTLSALERKLYLPYSTRRIAQTPSKLGVSLITFHWFYVDRSVPIAPYSSLILGYRTLSDTARVEAEMLVNELFREEEFHLLRDYLRTRHHEDLRNSMLVAPISATKPDTGTRAGGLRPFGRITPQDREEIFVHRLSDEPGYSLPFAVWGASVAAHPRRNAPSSANLAAIHEDSDD